MYHQWTPVLNTDTRITNIVRLWGPLQLKNADKSEQVLDISRIIIKRTLHETSFYRPHRLCFLVCAKNGFFAQVYDASENQAFHSLITHTSDSSLHSISTATINILDRAGSRGNSTIWRPRGVRLPVLSKAPKIHSWYIEFKILSCKVIDVQIRSKVIEVQCLRHA